MEQTRSLLLRKTGDTSGKTSKNSIPPPVDTCVWRAQALTTGHGQISCHDHPHKFDIQPYSISITGFEDRTAACPRPVSVLDPRALIFAPSIARAASLNQKRQRGCLLFLEGARQNAHVLSGVIGFSSVATQGQRQR
jgi:hypothetical protein